VGRISELGTTSAATSNSVLRGATRRHIPGEGILQTHRREILKYYKGWCIR
jgi:hypothetical protein